MKGNEKVILSVADVVADVVRERGVPELSAVDHTMESKYKDRASVIWICGLNMWLNQRLDGDRRKMANGSC